MIHILENKSEMVRLLLNHNADINIVDVGGQTPLWVAVERGYYKPVELLLDKHADVNISAKQIYNWQGFFSLGMKMPRGGLNGISPLWIASCKNHTEIIELLLDRNANIDKSPSFNSEYDSEDEMSVEDIEDEMYLKIIGNETPLWIASARNNEEAVNILLKNNASVNKAQNKGKTPLYIASELGNDKVKMKDTLLNSTDTPLRKILLSVEPKGSWNL